MNNVSVIRDISSSPYLQFVGKSLQGVEKFFRSWTYFPSRYFPLPGPSSISGSIEAITATAGAVADLAAAAFCKMRMWSPFVAPGTKIRLQDRLNESLQQAADCVKMVAMGILKAIPVAGQLSAMAIYSALAGKQAAENVSAEKDKTIDDLNKELEPLKTNFADLAKELNEKTKELSKRGEEINTLTAQIEELKKSGSPKVAELQAKIAEQEKALQANQGTITTKETELKSAQKQLDELKQQQKTTLATMEGLKAEKEKILKDKQLELDTKKQELDAARAKQAELTKAFDNLKKGSETEKAALTEKVAKAEKDFQAKKGEFEKQSKELGNLQKEVASVKQEIEREKSSHAKSIAAKETELTAKKQEVDQLKANVTKLTETRDQALAQQKAEEKKVSELTNKLHIAQEDAAQAHLEVQGVNDKMKELQAQLEKLQTKLNPKTSHKASSDNGKKAQGTGTVSQSGGSSTSRSRSHGS